MLHGGIRHSEGDEQVFSQPIFFEKRLIAGKQLFDDEIIDLFALAVPHLFVAGKMRKGIIRFLYLVLAAELGVFGKEGRVYVIWVLGAHALRYLYVLHLIPPPLKKGD